MDQVAVGRRLAAARKRAGIKTRDALAARVSLPRLGKETLGKIERGERPLYEHEAPFVARALEVPVSYFYEEETADTQLDRIEQRLVEAESDRAGMRHLIAQQNALLARQSQILAKIEDLVGVLRDLDVEVTEPREDAPTDERAKIPPPPDLPAPPAVEPIRRRGSRGTPRSA